MNQEQVMSSPVTTALIFQGIVAILLVVCAGFAVCYGCKLLSKKDVDEARENTTIKWKEIIFKTRNKGIILLAVACFFTYCAINVAPIYKHKGDEEQAGRFAPSAVELMFNAASKGFTKIVEYCISQGVDKNAVNEKGESVLIVAILGGHSDTAKHLIDMGSDTATITHDNRTALSVAKSKGLTVIITTLEEKGAKE